MNTLIVYLHLIAACVAVGVLLMQDLMLSKTRGRRLNIGTVKELEKAAQIILIALVVLWVSGLLLVVIGQLSNPQYLANQKLWAKIAVVVVLSANGVLLHRFSFPRVVSASGVAGLPLLEKLVVACSGGVSTVSWLFACYLGVARPWNHTLPFNEVLFVYFSLLMPACLLACAYVLSLSSGKRSASLPINSQHQALPFATPAHKGSAERRALATVQARRASSIQRAAQR